MSDTHTSSPAHPRGVLLMLAKAFPPVTGGVETYSEQLARAYLAHGWAVTVVTQGALATPGPGTRSYPEGDLMIQECGPGGQAKAAFQFRRLAGRVLRTQTVDALHATTWRPAAALLGIRHRAKRIITVHGREVMLAPRWARPIMRRLLTSADLVVAVSRTTRHRTARAARLRRSDATWTVSGNGISFPVAAATSVDVPRTGRVRLFTVARLVERKNLLGAIRALGRLPALPLARIDYVIAGDGPQRSQLEDEVKALGLSEVVRFAGRVTDDELIEHFRHADVFLHPQISLDDGKDFEGFGLVIADAMSFGCAVIAGVDGGPSDFVTDGKTGLLVDGTDVDSIGAAILALVEDADLRARLSAAGRSYALAELAWQRQAQRILESLAG
ncbi:glycosyltransferase family 4 protein [Microbacterium sp. NPDC055903]